MGALAFNKLRGCVACHQGEDGKGGLSGPELTDAGARLQPDFIAAYTADPQRFDPHIWMPTLKLKDQDIQRLTAYLVATWPRRQAMKIQMALALAAAVLLLTPTAGHADPPVEQIYETYCVQCHGLKRNGTGVNLPGLSVSRAIIPIPRAWATRPTTNSSRPSRKAASPSTSPC